LTNSSTRTAAAGGSEPSVSLRRAIVYDAVSTSAANVDRLSLSVLLQPLTP
jgi:hypothetical protein